MVEFNLLTYNALLHISSHVLSHGTPIEILVNNLCARQDPSYVPQMENHGILPTLFGAHVPFENHAQIMEYMLKYGAAST